MPKTTTQDRLSSDELHELFDLMSHPMISFDCGELCREVGDGMPVCCDHNNFHPLLFTDEFEWLREHKKAGWKKFKPATKLEKNEVDTLCDHLIYADCPGIENCDRDHRALVCRLFPFEPHVDRTGNIVGLAFITEDSSKCPLVAKPLKTFEKKYTRASIKVWQKIIDTYPAEKELYISESRKRERRAQRKGKKVRILK